MLSLFSLRDFLHFDFPCLVFPRDDDSYLCEPNKKKKKRNEDKETKKIKGGQEWEEWEGYPKPTSSTKKSRDQFAELNQKRFLE